MGQGTPTMTDADLIKLALDDVRARQKALLDLILFQDQQAMGLLRLYVTLGLAAASGAVAVLLGPSTFPFALGISLLAAVAPLFAGAVYCFRAAQAASVGFPGLHPSFWKWASDPQIEPADMRDAYLNQLSTSMDLNHDLNDRLGGLIKIAKLCGGVSPIVTLIAGLIAYGLTVN